MGTALSMHFLRVCFLNIHINKFSHLFSLQSKNIIQQTERPIEGRGTSKGALPKTKKNIRGVFHKLNIWLLVSFLDNLDFVRWYVLNIIFNLHLQILHHRVDKQYYMAGNKIPLQGRWAHFEGLAFILKVILLWPSL